MGSETAPLAAGNRKNSPKRINDEESEMKRYLLKLICYTTVLTFAAALSCAAQESFEAYPAGTRLTTQLSGARFADYAEVFAPTRVHTSGSKAVRGCAGCTEIRINFTPTVGTVSLDTGMDAEACNNDQCFNTAVRLQAFDSAGTLIMSSEPVSLSGFADINHGLQVHDAAQRIASVAVRFTNLGMSGLGRVTFDNLFFTVSGGSATPLPAPGIRFTDPADNALVLTSPWIHGHITAPAGVLGMCVAANTILTPSICGGETQGWVPEGTHSAGFSLAPMVLRPGINTINVLVRDNLAQTATAVLHVQVASSATGIDFAAGNLLVTQGVQKVPPSGSGNVGLVDGGGGGPRATYDGVKLARDAKTVVRFFANAASTGSLPAGVTLRPPALLFGFVDSGSAGTPGGPPRGERLGAALPGSPLSPDALPAALVAPAALSFDLLNENAGYQFTLPASWTEAGVIVLQAEINPQSASGAIPEANRSNNGFELEQVRFDAPHDPIRVYAIALTYTGAPGASL